MRSSLRFLLCGAVFALAFASVRELRRHAPQPSSRSSAAPCSSAMAKSSPANRTISSGRASSTSTGRPARPGPRPCSLPRRNPPSATDSDRRWRSTDRRCSSAPARPPSTSSRSRARPGRSRRPSMRRRCRCRRRRRLRRPRLLHRRVRQQRRRRTERRAIWRAVAASGDWLLIGKEVAGGRGRGIPVAQAGGGRGAAVRRRRSRPARCSRSSAARTALRVSLDDRVRGGRGGDRRRSIRLIDRDDRHDRALIGASGQNARRGCRP